MPNRKRTKAVDIVGYWVETPGEIRKYNAVQNSRCSKCNGKDINCPICHGQSIVKEKIKWYRLIKRLEKWLDKKLEI